MKTGSSCGLSAEGGSQRLPAGTILQGRYRISRELGAGGMGTVYEAIDLRLETVVALKETFSTDDRLRRQFEQEARLLAQLLHPCLPVVSDYFTERGRAFLVMQFISGPDLAQILSQQPGPFPRNHVIAWADQLLDALVYLHERDRQIIHRDIKPHNLKVMANGRIALLDFGLAKTRVADQSTTNSSHSIFGYTRRYSPPEQIRDLGTTPQSDIYALGATLYHLLTGVKPADSLERAAAVANSERDPLQPTRELNQLVDPALSAVLDKAMALNAKDRFTSAKEFREALAHVGREVLQVSEPAIPLMRKQFKVPPPRRKVEGTFDPFDSYSILKPEPEVFNISRRSRAPAMFVVPLAIAMVLVVLAYPSRVVTSVTDILNSRRQTTSNSVTSAAVLRENKSNSIATKGSIAGEHQSTRKDGQQKRRSTPKPADAKPPRVSLSP